MNQSPDGQWFYTREGQQCGPVTLAELRAKATEGGLNPRNDMVWTQGMADWKPAGDVDGVFERRSTEQVVSDQSSSTASPPAVVDPYTPPSEAQTMDASAQMVAWPGVRRRSFLLMTMVFPLVCNVGAAFLSPLLISQLGKEIATMASLGLMVVVFCAILYVGMQRLANLGMSRWWYLVNFVPVLNLWVGYRMFACPAGYAYHKKLDGAGVALAIIYWLMLLFVLLMILAMFALLFGFSGNPEIQQQFEKAIQQALQAGSTS